MLKIKFRLTDLWKLFSDFDTTRLCGFLYCLLIVQVINAR